MVYNRLISGYFIIITKLVQLKDLSVKMFGIKVMEHKKCWRPCRMLDVICDLLLVVWY